MRQKQNSPVQNGNNFSFRLKLAMIVVLLFLLAIATRIFILMVMEHDFYTALAKGSHEIYSKLVPQRGKIYLKDGHNNQRYPLAINREFGLVYINPNQIKEDQAKTVQKKLTELFNLKKKDRKKILEKILKDDDPYEVIKEKVKLSKLKKIKTKDIPGVYVIKRPYRYYPERDLAAPVVGFVGRNKKGEKIGRYGVEGYWDKELTGKGGFRAGTKSASGSIIPLNSEIKPAKPGADIYLTLDRTLQYKLCNKLQRAQKKYKAESASMLVMNPNTGAIEVLCSLPDFNPNKYSETNSVSNYNNSVIYNLYEIGSIFKPIVMASAIDKGVVSPNTPFLDPGAVTDICDSPIKNSREKKYDKTDMTGVLEKSINTGMVEVAQELGKESLVSYIEKFGFGTKTGIRINNERSGSVDSLYINEGGKIDCYAATASFGQGITATPLQMVTSYSALINGGRLLKPYIVNKVEYSDGQITRTQPKQIRRVIDKQTSNLIQAMLVSVIENGHAGAAKVKGYKLGGKTGTAQISKKDSRGYTNETNHSFVGFGPARDPRYVVLVKFHKSNRRFSAQTAAPTFREISDYLLDHYQIPPKNKSS